MYERRLADKLSYFDWKLSYMMDEEDLEFIHKKLVVVEKDVNKPKAIT